MTPTRFTFAVSSYDHVRAVVDGKIPIEGTEPLFMQLPIPEMFRRFVKYQDWDVSEVSFVKYVTMRAAGDDRITAIPVFPSRMYRHTSIYVRADRVHVPEDLAGGRVGIPEWTNSAGVWARGLLADMHGLDAAEITWYAGGIDRPGRAMVLAAPHMPPDVRVIQVEDRSLEQMLWAGDLDAVIVPNPPSSIASSDRSGGLVRRLFTDPQAAERAYWEKTNCLPIMHVVAISRGLLDRAPGIAARIYKALDTARAEYFDRLLDPDVSRVPLPWIGEHLESLGRDPWPYGVEANRATIECLLRYGRTQGLLADRLEPADLFGEWSRLCGYHSRSR
jgi:4,5-dihydroxyphthalate decarboxylase